jgi:hypothetical protein
MPSKPMPGWMSTLQIVFVVMCVIGGINLARPANNTAVLVYRLALVTIGLIGSIVILVLYLRLNRSSDDEVDEDEDDTGDYSNGRRRRENGADD